MPATRTPPQLMLQLKRGHAPWRRARPTLLPKVSPRALGPSPDGEAFRLWTPTYMDFGMPAGAPQLTQATANTMAQYVELISANPLVSPDYRTLVAGMAGQRSAAVRPFKSVFYSENGADGRSTKTPSSSSNVDPPALGTSTGPGMYYGWYIYNQNPDPSFPPLDNQGIQNGAGGVWAMKSWLPHYRTQIAAWFNQEAFKTVDASLGHYVGIEMDVMGPSLFNDLANGWNPGNVYVDHSLDSTAGLGYTKAQMYDLFAEFTRYMSWNLSLVDSDTPLTTVNCIQDSANYWTQNGWKVMNGIIGVGTDVCYGAGHAELWFRGPNSSVTNWPLNDNGATAGSGSWQDNVNEILDANARKYPILFQVKLWCSDGAGVGWADSSPFAPITGFASVAQSKQWARMAFGSFLIGTDTRHFINYRDDSINVAYATIVQGNSTAYFTQAGRQNQLATNYYGGAEGPWWANAQGLGPPLETFAGNIFNVEQNAGAHDGNYLSGSYYQRHFAAGMVYVNPYSSTAAMKMPTNPVNGGSQGNYVDIDGTSYAAGQTVNVPAHSALILRFTPSASLHYTVLPSETGTTSDTVARAQAAFRTAVDSNGPASDSAARAAVLLRTAADFFSSSDSPPARVEVAARVATDTVGPATATVARAGAYARTDSDSVGPALDATPARAYAGGRAATDTVGPPADAVAPRQALTRTPADAVGPAADILASPVQALTLFPYQLVSPNLATANQLLSAALGGANQQVAASKYGATAAPFWMEMWSQGNASIATQASQYAPTGHGYLKDLQPCTIVAGTWTMSIRAALNTAGATLTGDVHIRAYKYNGGTYTLICEAVATGQSFVQGSIATYTATATGVAAVAFAAGDMLYIDVQVNVTAATGGISSSTIQMSFASSHNYVTPGFTVTRLLVTRRTASDTVGPTSDSVSAFKPGISYTASVTDTVGAAADAVARVFAGLRNAAENLTLSDAVAAAQALGRSVVDTIGPAAASVARVFVGFRSAIDTVSGSDIVTRILAAVRARTDTVGPATDASPTRQATLQRSVTDSVGPTGDVPVTKHGTARSVVDSVGPAFDVLVAIWRSRDQIFEDVIARVRTGVAFASVRTGAVVARVRSGAATATVRTGAVVARVRSGIANLRLR